MDGQERKPQRPTFPKRERIISRTLIEQLFLKGNNHSIAAYPLRIVYILKERSKEEPPVQVLVSVSKRHFKQAVRRNRAKRQIREAYRHHKAALTEKIPEGKGLAVGFIWLADELYDSQRVTKSIRKLLDRLVEQLEQL